MRTHTRKEVKHFLVRTCVRAVCSTHLLSTLAQVRVQRADTRAARRDARAHMQCMYMRRINARAPFDASSRARASCMQQRRARVMRAKKLPLTCVNARASRNSPGKRRATARGAAAGIPGPGSGREIARPGDQTGRERGSPERIRTAASALRGRRPRPLDDGAKAKNRTYQFFCSGGRTRTPNNWTRTSCVADYTTPE